MGQPLEGRVAVVTGASRGIGKGIAVGWETVCSGATQLTSSLAGNIVFLVGNGSAYTITLPAASTMAAGSQRTTLRRNGMANMRKMNSSEMAGR